MTGLIQAARPAGAMQWAAAFPGLPSGRHNFSGLTRGVNLPGPAHEMAGIMRIDKNLINDERAAFFNYFCTGQRIGRQQRIPGLRENTLPFRLEIHFHEPVDQGIIANTSVHSDSI